MFTETQNVLTRLGLKEVDAEIYLACLKNPEGLFVVDIVRLTKIKRSTVNLILDRLLRKGFVTYHLEGARKLFLAESPDALLARLEDSVSDLKNLIPLLRFTAGTDKKTKVRFFEGKQGVEHVFNDILLTMRVRKEVQKEVVAISSGTDLFAILPDHQKQFMNKRVKEGVSLRWIAPESPISRKFDKKDLRKMKFFDAKKYQFNVELDVYGEKIALISLDKTLSAVIIENKILAESFRSLFNLLWDSLQ